MSFGSGIGDVIAVSSLARSIWSYLRDASDQFNVIRNDVAALSVILEEITRNLSGLRVTDKQTEELSKLIKDCHNVLIDTENLIRKNESLSIASSGLELRNRMVSSAAFLNLYNTSLVASITRRPRQRFLIPFSRDRNFVGREDVFKEIEARLKSEHRVALCGIGGVGKSQIAIEYCYRLRDANPDIQIFWVNASSTIRFSHAYNDIATRCQLIHQGTPADAVQIVHDWLSDEANGKWLMVLDNADDAQVLFDSSQETHIKELEPQEGVRPLAAYLPQTESGSILITSRDRDVGFRLTSNRQSMIHIESMSPEEAISVVEGRLVDDKSSGEEKRELVERLDFIPLAITQASAFISSQNITIPQYIECLLQSTNEVLSMDTRDLRRDPQAHSSIFKTWHMTFQLIIRDAPAAAHLMSLMCALDRQTVPKFLVRDEYRDSLEFEDALAPLIGFSLIRAKEDGQSLEIHRLVRIAMAMWLEEHGLTAKFRDEAIRLLSKHFPGVDDSETKTDAGFRQDLARGLSHDHPAHHLPGNEMEDLKASEEIETASIISIQTPSLVSASTLPSSVMAEDTAQEFAVLLFHDEVLHPLLFEASRKMEIDRLKRNFTKLLTIYSGDLREEATLVLEKAAVELVRKRIPYITNCVWDSLDPDRDIKAQAMDKLVAQTSKREDRLKQYLQYLIPEDVYLPEVLVIENMQGDPIDDMSDADSESPHPIADVNFANVTKFLTESAAFAQLRKSFRDFVTPYPESMQPPDSLAGFPPHDLQRAMDDGADMTDTGDPLESSALGSTRSCADSERYPSVSRVCDALIDWISAEFFELREKPLKEGMKRARWQCVCGRNLYDDFYEIVPGAVRELEELLDFSHLPVRNVSPENEGSRSTGSQGNTDWCQQSTLPQASHASSMHPTGSEEDQQRESALRQGVKKLMAPDGAGKWILPVFQEKLYGAKAFHLPVEHIDSDETFFLAMREHYDASTTKLHRWLSMRGVKKIHHVKFILTHRGADVAKFDDWPPEDYIVPKGQWIYKGCHTRIKLIPHVGSNYMMNLWQNPHHTDRKTYQSHTPGLFQRARDPLFKLRTQCINYLRDRFSRPVDDFVGDITRSSQDNPIAAAARNREARQDQEAPSANRYDETADVELQATKPLQDSRSSYVFLRTPKKLGEQLTPDNRDPPEGWGIYFEEGFRVPPFFVVVYCVCVFGSLALATSWYRKYGLAAFGALGWVVGLLSLVAMVLFKWAD